MRVEFLATFIDQKFPECLSPKSISLCKSVAGLGLGARIEALQAGDRHNRSCAYAVTPFRPRARRFPTEDYLVIPTSWMAPACLSPVLQHRSTKRTLRWTFGAIF